MLKQRGILKWAGLVVCGLVLLAWTGSTIWQFGRLCEDSEWRIQDGCVAASWPRWTGHAPQWRLRLTTGFVEGRVGLELPAFSRFDLSANTYSTTVTIPLWLPFLLVALPTAFMFYRDRKRIPPGHCSTCAYNLTGAAHERCPECGEPTEMAGDIWA